MRYEPTSQCIDVSGFTLTIDEHLSASNHRIWRNLQNIYWSSNSKGMPICNQLAYGQHRGLNHVLECILHPLTQWALMSVLISYWCYYECVKLFLSNSILPNTYWTRTRANPHVHKQGTPRMCRQIRYFTHGSTLCHLKGNLVDIVRILTKS